MRYIESTLETLDLGDVDEAIFYTNWNLADWAEEMDASQSLGSMITFSGSVDVAWATTSRSHEIRSETTNS